VKGEFVVLVDGVKRTYQNYKDIPKSFDNLIKFDPEYPEPPHTQEQHEIMETYNDKLMELMKRETK